MTIKNQKNQNRLEIIYLSADDLVKLPGNPRRGEAPFASHLLFDQPGILDDTVPAEREQGIAAGFVWAEAAGKVAVYTDHGISEGMQRGIDRAKMAGQVVEFRRIEP
jgi:hypothetical protein